MHKRLKTCFSLRLGESTSKNMFFFSVSNINVEKDVFLCCFMQKRRKTCFCFIVVGKNVEKDVFLHCFIHRRRKTRKYRCGYRIGSNYHQNIIFRNLGRDL